MTSCENESSDIDILVYMNNLVTKLESENDSLRQELFEKTYELNTNVVPVVLMKNSFIHVGDSAEITTIIGTDSIPKTSAKILLGTSFKNEGVNNVYDTIVCDGTVGKISVFGKEVGRDTVFGVYILTKGSKESVHPFNITYEVLD